MAISDGYRYSGIAVLIFGILGNSLVIISILRKRSLLKSNYYFLVFQLAICDLGFAVIVFCYFFGALFGEKPFLEFPTIRDCLIINIEHVFNFGGIAMMLVISMLRYRATVHPLKPASSRRTLIVCCVLVYIIALVAGYGPYVTHSCRNSWGISIPDSVVKILHVSYLFMDHLLPTVFMAVVYYRISRAVMKQNRYIKRVCSNIARRNTSSSTNITRYIRNRRTLLVCLSTVLCYGLGSLPFTVIRIRILSKENFTPIKYWVFDFSAILLIAASSAVNPLVYGILDKKLLLFCKLCPKSRQQKQRGVPGPV